MAIDKKFTSSKPPADSLAQEHHIDRHDNPHRHLCLRPGLAAKPIIDIMLGLPALNNIAPYIPALKSAGFHLQPQMAAAMPDRHDFAKPAAHPRAVQLHAVALDSGFWRDKLAFRDALRADGQLAEQYADLKRQLAQNHSDGRAAYTDAKSAFIAAVLAAAAGKPHDKPLSR
ncbi:GrpB family protein [Chromobacterium violaceum]